MFGAKEGHTIFCDENCSVSHHEVLVELLLCKRNDAKSLDRFKLCVHNMVAHGWDKNSDIPDEEKHFRFPLVHWASVYGKLAVLKWLAEEDFDLASTNKEGETALHRLVACQAHERAVDTRCNRTGGRRFSLSNIIQVFTKVLAILTENCPQILLMFEYIERNTPLQLCLKLLNDANSQRLTLYYESLFTVLCERLENLLKKDKLSAEFVRGGLCCRDKNGNTLWHIAAASRSIKVLGAINTLVKGVGDVDFHAQNNNGDTPRRVAMKNAFPEMASLIEDYKSSTSLLPVVKMEPLPECDECCCEHRADPDQHDGEHSFTDQGVHDRSDSSCLEPSLIVNASLTTERSFTEPLKKLPMTEQQKVVLTVADEATTDKIVDTERTPIRIDQAAGNPGSDLVLQVDGGNSENCNMEIQEDSFTPDSLVIEKQIDLNVNITESTNNSMLNHNNKGMEIVHDSEHLPCLERGGTPTAELNLVGGDTQEDTLHSANSNSHCNDKTCSEILDTKSPSHNIQLPSPPVSESCSSSYQMESISDMQTPRCAESSGSKGVSVTPVLLVKLLSEPDVSERFQSLLKEVITGDKEKVDSAQSALHQLKMSKSKLEDEITNNEESLQDMTVKRTLLNESIKRLQEELAALQNSEEATKLKLAKLKHERDNVGHKIHNCESTCKRLKRRLSDCAGALNGLSPKSQKKC